MKSMRWLAACLALCCGQLDAADPPQQATGVSFYRDIRPIFQAHCYGCHQPAKQGGAYEMTEFANLLKGGESGDVAIQSGKPDASYLIDQIRPVNGEAEMPKGKPAGVRCVQLTADNQCQLFGKSERPLVCIQFNATLELCGTHFDQALRNLIDLEENTAHHK